MEKVFTAVATKLGVGKDQLRFLYDGGKVSGSTYFVLDYEFVLNADLIEFLPIIVSAHTPKTLEMEDGDQIDCMVEQQGGMGC